MRTLTLSEKQSLKLTDPEWYECLSLTEEEAEVIRKHIADDDLPSFMRGAHFGDVQSNGGAVHVLKLGKRGSNTAARRLRFLEKLGLGGE